MNLLEFFEGIYFPQRLLGKSPNTSRLYRISIRNFGRTVGRDPTLDDLNDTSVASHIQRMMDDGRAAATANKDRAQLLTLWRHAHRIGLLERWPNVPQLIEPERTPRAWLPEELARLFEAVEKQTGHFGPVPRSLWWKSMILLCLDTGERIQAVRVARWEWISGEWITFPAEARKGRRRDRSYKLSLKTLGHLMAIKLVSDETIFPWPYCEMYLWQLYGRVLVDAGLPNGRRDKFHKLRRTTASVVHSAGMDAQEALDHQYRRTTQRYLDPRFTKEKQPSDAVSVFLAGKKVRG